tara:strand:- start:4230 stop:4457 length:228 start_codon:yes stop_codon:yes gene_type:complete
MKDSIKINGGISMGNLLVILTMVASVIFSYSRLAAEVEDVNMMVGKKANKEMVDLKFGYIQQQLDEIKNLIKERD